MELDEKAVIKLVLNNIEIAHALLLEVNDNAPLNPDKIEKALYNIDEITAILCQSYKIIINHAVDNPC
jgi:hypothetical protein